MQDHPNRAIIVRTAHDSRQFRSSRPARRSTIRSGAGLASEMHNGAMHPGTREDEDQGRRRTVVWSDGSETDLGVLVVATVASLLLGVSVVCAVVLHGLPQVVAAVLAVLSGLVAAMMVIPLLLIFGGVFIVKGMVAEEPSIAQRASWVVAAALLGALLGSDAYSVGMPGLLTGPILFAAVLAVLHARPGVSTRARRRALELTGVVAVTALGASLTIFLGSARANGRVRLSARP
jgi:hypothetical protein